jgi:hypothetical protein
MSESCPGPLAVLVALHFFICLWYFWDIVLYNGGQLNDERSFQFLQSWMDDDYFEFVCLACPKYVRCVNIAAL